MSLLCLLVQLTSLATPPNPSVQTDERRRVTQEAEPVEPAEIGHKEATRGLATDNTLPTRLDFVLLIINNVLYQTLTQTIRYMQYSK